MSYGGINYFNDYMDYRFNRKHRGALVRAILNQAELDRTRPYVSPFPRLTYSDFYYRPDLDRLYPYTWRYHTSSYTNPDRPTGRFSSSYLDETPVGAGPTSPDSAWVSRRYPYRETMKELWDDLSGNEKLRNEVYETDKKYDRYSMARTLDQPIYTEIPRLWSSYLDTDYASVASADIRDMRARSLDRFSRERSVSRALSRARSLERDVPVYRPVYSTYYSYTSPSNYYYDSYDSSFFNYGPKSYYPPYTPYHTYRMRHLNNTTKRDNPPAAVVNIHKPYEYKWRNTRYSSDPTYMPLNSKKELDEFKATKSLELQKWFAKREKRMEERKRDQEILAKKRQEREDSLGISRTPKLSNRQVYSHIPNMPYSPTTRSAATATKAQTKLDADVTFPDEKSTTASTQVIKPLKNEANDQSLANDTTLSPIPKSSVLKSDAKGEEPEDIVPKDSNDMEEDQKQPEGDRKTVHDQNDSNSVPEPSKEDKLMEKVHQVDEEKETKAKDKKTSVVSEMANENLVQKPGECVEMSGDWTNPNATPLRKPDNPEKTSVQEEKDPEPCQVEQKADHVDEKNNSFSNAKLPRGNETKEKDNPPKDTKAEEEIVEQQVNADLPTEKPGRDESITDMLEKSPEKEEQKDDVKDAKMEVENVQKVNQDGLDEEERISKPKEPEESEKSKNITQSENEQHGSENQDNNESDNVNTEKEISNDRDKEDIEEAVEKQNDAELSNKTEEAEVEQEEQIAQTYDKLNSSIRTDPDENQEQSYGDEEGTQEKPDNGESPGEIQEQGGNVKDPVETPCSDSKNVAEEDQSKDCLPDEPGLSHLDPGTNLQENSETVLLAKSTGQTLVEDKEGEDNVRMEYPVEEIEKEA